MRPLLTAAGSSPLTRGKRLGHNNRRGAYGLIPAHAGKTAQAANPDYPREAHPRSRGENTRWHRRARAHSGSSPLTRGKRKAKAVAKDAGGLIPAHAGKTVMVRPLDWSAGAHPRSRGENIRGPRPRNPDRGSSPLTRGKPGIMTCPRWSTGLIPAHAGKTQGLPRYACASTAHPRSRGENAPTRAHRLRRCGSSPLTRGKRQSIGNRRHQEGLIPAHAGKTVPRVVP